MKTLVIVAHPEMAKSIANKRISEKLKEQTNIEVRNIFDLYSDYKINVEAEQEVLLESDTILPISILVV